MDPQPSAGSRRKPPCPRCGTPSPRFFRYAFSSWLFPLACAACGARFYLGYHPVVFLLLWAFIFPIYEILLLFLCIAVLPYGLVLPAVLLITLASSTAMPFLGVPRLK
jgi:hypothetical protein